MLRSPTIPLATGCSHPSAAHRNCPASLAGWIDRHFAGVSSLETGGEFPPYSTGAPLHCLCNSQVRSLCQGLLHLVQRLLLELRVARCPPNTPAPLGLSALLHQFKLVLLNRRSCRLLGEGHCQIRQAQEGSKSNRHSSAQHFLQHGMLLYQHKGLQRRLPLSPIIVPRTVQKRQ